MSTKTLRKRIALVAVTALGAGLLSVTPANAANTLVAATVIGTGNANVAPDTGATNPTTVANVLNIASELSLTGSTTSSSTAHADVKSIGLLTVGDISGATRVAGTTQTATLLSTGTLSLISSTSSSAILVKVTGGTISASKGATAFSPDSASIATAGTVADFSVSIRPSSGQTSMTVQMYASDDATGPELLSGAKTGVLTGQVNVTVAAASVAGVIAPARSGVFFANSSSFDATATSDGANTGKADFTREISLLLRTRDGYGNPIYGPGLLSATATGGAYVAFGASAGTASNAYSTINGATEIDGDEITVTNPTSKPMASTVTVSFNGTVIGSRTVGFSGEVSKIVLSGAVIGKTTGTANTVKYKLYDAAGNQVYTKYTGVGSNAATPVSGLAGDSSVLGGAVTNIAQAVDNESEISPSSGATSDGYLAFSCAATAGTGKVAAVYTNVSGTTAKSDAISVSCAGDAVSYKASYKSATAKPGDIATLIVQFYDDKGNKANDITDVEAGDHTVSTAGLDIISGPSTSSGYDSANKLDQGAISYTYSVKTATGTFTNKIDFPTVNTAGAALLTEAATATITISDGSTGLNDVLKAIVSLIASINKQIAALQKALIKKK
jgi:trimeric autotransporter adhesin